MSSHQDFQDLEPSFSIIRTVKKTKFKHFIREEKVKVKVKVKIKVKVMIRYTLPDVALGAIPPAPCIGTIE